MKVGSRGDYGLRALVYLAQVPLDGEPVQVHTIAQEQQIPEDYLRQLLVNLRGAGLVKSVRGPHGGYLLAKAPEHISMGEVIFVLEGPPDTMHCRFIHAGGERCALKFGCEIRGRWQEATRKMTEVLTTTTLADLLRQFVPVSP